MIDTIKKLLIGLVIGAAIAAVINLSCSRQQEVTVSDTKTETTTIGNKIDNTIKEVKETASKVSKNISKPEWLVRDRLVTVAGANIYSPVDTFYVDSSQYIPSYTKWDTAHYSACTVITWDSVFQGRMVARNQFFQGCGVDTTTITNNITEKIVKEKKPSKVTIGAQAGIYIIWNWLYPVPLPIAIGPGIGAGGNIQILPRSAVKDTVIGGKTYRLK